MKALTKIISLKPHNSVEIAMGKRSQVIVHVNRLKPYHDDSKFQTFTDNFQKQGADEDFDFPPNKEDLLTITKHSFTFKFKFKIQFKIKFQFRTRF